MLRKLSFLAPFLVAVFSVISLYAANADRLDATSMIMPEILGLVLAGVFLLLFWLFKWTSQSAPFVAAIWTGVVLYWNIMPIPLDVFFLVASLFIGIASKQYTVPAAILVCGIALLGSLGTSIQAGIINAGKSESQINPGPFLNKPGQPNIYFIVPDRMPSPAAMRESGINPDETINDLRSLGFYVKENQISNDPYTIDWPEDIYTTRTMRYFASVLNGGLAIPMTIPYKDCRTMIQDNAVFTWLHGKGYEIINIPSWFTETKFFTNQDHEYPFEDVTLLERFFNDELGEAYFSRTIFNGFNFRVFETFGSQRKIEMERLNWQSKKILEIASSGPNSTFVISHFTLPHEPFVYGNPEDSVPDQYYTNIRQALLFLDELAANIRTLDPSATIIIQSDEGMAYRKPAELNNDLSKTQWSGVFTAWYLPYVDVAKNNLDYIKHTDILGVVVGDN
jgi:hypothetical protein